MKRMKFKLGLLGLALATTTFFVSCNNEDDILENKDSTAEQYAPKESRSEFESFLKPREK